MKTINQKQSIFAIKLLIPALILSAIVHFIPTAWGIFISLRELNIYYISRWASAPFVGFNNYYRALASLGSEFWSSFLVTVIFAISSVLGCLFMGMLGANLLNHRFKGRNIIRGILLLPYIIPGVVSLTTLRFMLLQNWGIVNSLLMKTHIITAPISWLTGKMSLFSIILGNIWIRWPLWFIVLLAGLQSIPNELYEAASVDGANQWQMFKNITFPSLKPLVIVLSVLTTLWSFNNFTIPFILTGGSPSKEASILSINIWMRSFKNWDFGLGAAMSVVMMLIMFVLVILYLKITKLDGKEV